jgi:hypothetical protein
VVLPEPRLRGEIAPPSVVQRERTRARIDGQRCGPRRIDPDADHAVAREARRPLCVGERAADRLAQAGQVIRRVLPREMRVAGIEQDAVVAARVRKYARSRGRTVRAVHRDGAH